MIATAKTAPQTRAAIVAAAEALYRRGGADAVTLSAVARETDFARGVVYAHFSSRAELIATVVPAAAAVDHTEEEDKKKPEGESYDNLMRQQAEALNALTKQVIVSKPHQRDGAEAALSRLDARLTVAEHSLAALEQKTGDQFKSMRTETSALAERLHGLRQRLEKFEERQTTALAQLRFEVHNLNHGRDPLPEPQDVTPPGPPPDEYLPETSEPPETEDKQPEPPRMADFLLSARRAARDAAEREAVPAPHRRKPRWKRLFGRRRWVIVAVLAVLVAWFDIYVFAHYQPAEGAQPQTVKAALRPAVKARPVWSPRAQLVRGLRYLNGTGLPVDVVKARMWIERAALRGQPVAENLMGVLYQTGTGVPTDMPVAIGWYEGAAKHGNLKAITNLGKIYAGGWPEGTDFAKAAGWFAMAAAYGEVDAQFNLAVLYERGAGVSQSSIEAAKWYAIAAKSGDGKAAIRATTLTSQLTPDEQDAVEEAVAAYTPQQPDPTANETPAIPS